MKQRMPLPPIEPDWSYGTFEGAERLRRELAQRTTLAQRLRWVEQTLAFAHKAGVLKPREIPAEWEQAEWKQD